VVAGVAGAGGAVLRAAVVRRAAGRERHGRAQAGGDGELVVIDLVGPAVVADGQERGVGGVGAADGVGDGAPADGRAGDERAQVGGGGGGVVGLVGAAVVVLAGEDVVLPRAVIARGQERLHQLGAAGGAHVVEAETVPVLVGGGVAEEAVEVG